MRISELARRSGIPVPTLKYYIRSSVLPGGRVSAPNQAEYDESHLRRLRLVRALLDIGGLSVQATQDVLRAADDDTATTDDLVRVAGCALRASRRPFTGDACRPTIAARIDALTARHGWWVPAGSEAVQQLADVLASLSTLDLDPTDGTLDAYAAVATGVARHDRDTMRATGATGEALIARTVMNEALLVALHRLAAAAG